MKRALTFILTLMMVFSSIQINTIKAEDEEKPVTIEKTETVSLQHDSAEPEEPEEPVETGASYLSSAEEALPKLVREPVQVKVETADGVRETKGVRDSEKVAFAHKTNSDYGYQDLLNNIGNQAMTDLYIAIDDSQEAFFAEGQEAQYNADVSLYYSGLIEADPSLDINQIYQVATLYR
ncbi:MAG: hypothetical protein IIZ47_01250, partial [Erysipelotrichaceae bacterium]|nr:hypothetical protein [Erysipelotrichaceae bacterium]